MKHSQLIKELAQDTGIKPDIINYILHRFISISLEALIKDSEISLKNWGTLKLFKNNENNNLSVKFKVSRQLKQALRLQLVDLKDSPGAINRDSWLNGLSWYKKDNNVKKNNTQNDTFDDFFIYDDE